MRIALALLCLPLSSLASLRKYPSVEALDRGLSWPAPPDQQTVESHLPHQPLKSELLHLGGLLEPIFEGSALVRMSTVQGATAVEQSATVTSAEPSL